MAKEEKRSFVLYYEYRDHLQILTDEERGKLLMALMDYGATGEAPKLEGAALMAFSFITSQMDRDAEKYAEKCKKRSEAGKQGGRPRKAKASESEADKASAATDEKKKAKKANAFQEKQSKAKKADNENDNDNKNDYVYENENENDTTPLPPSKGGKESPSCPAEPVAVDKTPYKVIVTLYHDRCKSYPKLRGLSGKRKEAIAARWEEHEHSLDVFRELFEKAETSRFLKGDNERNWKADFNWLMDGDNMAKVLEGLYDKRLESSSSDECDFFREYEMALRRGVPPSQENPAPTAADNEEIRMKGEALKARLGS